MTAYEMRISDWSSDVCSSDLATLAGNYGIYNGFELCEAAAVPGKEEYLNSEKYEIRAWDWDRPGNIREDVALVNCLRRGNPALRDFTNLEFYNAWNDHVLVYGRRTRDLSSFVLIAVNLDPDRKSPRLNSSHSCASRMPSSASTKKQIQH